MFYLGALTDQRSTDLQLWELSCRTTPVASSRGYASRSHLAPARLAVGRAVPGLRVGNATGVVTLGRALGC